MFKIIFNYQDLYKDYTIKENYLNSNYLYKEGKDKL